MSNYQITNIPKEEAKLAKRQAQLKRARDAERQQRRKLATLKRNARTHRLCTRGGMVESLLKRPGCIDPGELEDEQVQGILRTIFALPEVQRTLENLLPPAADPNGSEPDGSDDFTT